MPELHLLNSPEPKKKRYNIVQEFIFGAFYPIWATRYKNKKYYLQLQDGKLVKEFLNDNPDILDDIAEIQTRASLYIKDEWWIPQRHPAWGLVRHFNRYIPEAVKPLPPKKIIQIKCEHCGELRPPFGNCLFCGE